MVRALLLFACFIALIAAACGSDGDSEDDDETDETPTAAVTSQAPASPGVTGTPSGPTPTPEGFTNARQALDAYIRNQLGEENAGPCPTGMAPGQPPVGLCSTQLHESAELTTYLIGAPFGAAVGELVLTRDAAGQVWTVTFVPSPVMGGELAVGRTAVVFGAGDCLNFRTGPGQRSQVITCQLDGTTGKVIEGPVGSEGMTWWRLEGLGWASAEFLGVVGP